MLNWFSFTAESCVAAATAPDACGMTCCCGRARECSSEGRRAVRCREVMITRCSENDSVLRVRQRPTKVILKAES